MATNMEKIKEELLKSYAFMDDYVNLIGHK
jgi:hypothetical protein